MISAETREIIVNGLWKQNPGVVQILGMCPLLAISNNVVNALSLGLATTLVMALSNLAVSLVRNLIPHAVRIPVFILLVAVLVTAVDLLIHAYALSLYLVLGIFIPLIVTNCIVLARVEAFASKRTALHSTLDGIMMGLGLTAVLVVLEIGRASCRERVS
jgi:electron transport complex protein RnfE